MQKGPKGHGQIVVLELEELTHKVECFLSQMSVRVSGGRCRSVGVRVSATDCYSVFVSWSGLLHLENATGDSFHRAGVCHPLPWNLWRFNPSDVKTAQTAKTERAEIPRKQLEKTVISVHLLRVRIIELDRS